MVATAAVWVAALVSCYDGDTCKMEVEIWPDVVVQTQVRLRDVDAPEIAGKCVLERVLAKAARDEVSARLESASVITLTRVGTDKYGGRVLAEVLADGQDVGDLLVAENLARPYSGGPRQGWCE